MKISKFRSATDNDPKPVEIEWDALADRLCKHDVRIDKDGPAWSPATFSGSRLNENVVAVSCVVLDLDTGCDPEVFEPRWDGLEYVVYSTHSSTLDCPKFRAVFPLDQPIPRDEWREAWERFNLGLCSGANDPATKDPARLYYLPSCDPEGTKFAHRKQGKCVSLSDMPPAPVVSTQANEVDWSGDIGQKAKAFIQNGTTENQRLSAVSCARSLWRASIPVGEAIDMVFQGLSRSPQKDPKWPWKKADAEKIVGSVYTSPPPPLTVSIDPESALLACGLHGEGRRLCADMKPEHFRYSKNAEVFEGVRRILARGGTVNPTTVSHEIGDELGYVQKLARIGPGPYSDYRESVLKAWRMREVVKRAEAVSAAAQSGDYESVVHLSSRFGHGLLAATTRAFDVQEVIDSIRNKGVSGVKGIKTGIEKWDEACIDGLGLRAGRPTLLAAEEGVGKSYLGLQVVRNVCREGKRVMFGSFELDREEVVERLARQESGLRDLGHAKWANKEAEWNATLKEMEFWDLTVYDDALSADEGQYIEDFVNFVRAEHEKKPVDLVVVDYLQLLDTHRKASQERLVIKMCSRIIRAEAKRTNVPWLVICQSETPPKTPQDKEPWPYIRGGREPQKDAALVLYLVEDNGVYKLKCTKNRYHSGILVNMERLPRKWSRTLPLNAEKMTFGE